MMKLRMPAGTSKSATILLIAAAIIAIFSAENYLSMRAPGGRIDRVSPHTGFKPKMLSDYFSGIRATPADTPVYIQQGEAPGGTVLVLGGTHADEPAGFLSAILFLENTRVRQGRLIIIPFANRMARTHNYPQEAYPQFFQLHRPDGGKRTFRFGARTTNPIYEWPNPDIYVHPSSGQHLAGIERSNLNRCYPGLPDGSITEKLAYAILQLIKKEKVDMAFDLHEASPEYPVVNAIVAHERSMELAAMAMMELEGLKAKMPLRLEPSPEMLRGLSHREWGDATETLAILMETANPCMGRFRGKTDEALILSGADKAYAKAARLGQLAIPYDGRQTLKLRVARHVTAIRVCIEMLESVKAECGMRLEGVPTFDEMLTKGVGAFLAPENG